MCHPLPPPLATLDRLDDLLLAVKQEATPILLYCPGDWLSDHVALLAHVLLARIARDVPEARRRLVLSAVELETRKRFPHIAAATRNLAL